MAKAKKREEEKQVAIKELEKNYEGLTPEEIVQRKKEEEEAASKIQARYKGIQTRKEMKEKGEKGEKEKGVKEKGVKEKAEEIKGKWVDIVSISMLACLAWS